MGSGAVWDMFFVEGFMGLLGRRPPVSSFIWDGFQRLAESGV